MTALDEWQKLKAIAIELSVITSPGLCECSRCETKRHTNLETKENYPLFSLEKSSSFPELPKVSYQPASLDSSIHDASYQRLFETVCCILERSSNESSSFLARHTWCQDISLYTVWNTIQQSRTASLPLLVRSLSTESSASLMHNTPSTASVGRRFRKDVQQLLEKAFQCKPWPNPVEKTMLARRCGLTVRQVGVWFSNRRARCWPTSTTIATAC
ncbi:hypothetical protein PNEG_02276 [Pneumocystis murina B123]|uniref:Homeobox domain-containing protein n=1 Tax=Pneumocystis murina (strain B123) TaxID=1069680 RepID=M7PFU6_PNEMU|nr:hypothetical protein PNEG_02276 [Pneumocystis murina B123]EMR09319.1 hypothetical protein PNEG_02276 [Pneumocystis murina B123]